MLLIKNIFNFLEKKEKNGLYVLMVMVFFSMILETLSIGAIIPILTSVFDQGSNDKWFFLQNLFEVVGYTDRNSQIIFSGIFLTVVFLIKNLFLVYLLWYQQKYIFDLQANLSYKMFRGYLNKEYEFHLLNNSAQLIRNVTTEVTAFITVVNSAIIIITDIIIFCALIILIMYVDLSMAIIVLSLLAGTGYLFYANVKKYNSLWGISRQKHEGKRIQYVQEGLGAIKDIIILGRVNESSKKYQESNKIYSTVARNQAIVQQVPKFFFETLAIMLIVSVIVISILFNNSVNSTLFTLGIFGAAGYRLMPLVTRIISSIQTLRFFMPVIPVLSQIDQNVIQYKGEDLLNKEIKKIHFEDSIEIKNLSFNYSGSNRNILTNINFKIPKGSTVGIQGPSGAGKSTLVDIILGLLKSSSGKIEVDGVNIHDDISSWQKMIGYVPQTIFISDDSLARNIALGIREDDIDYKRLDKALEISQLSQLICDLKDGYNTYLGERGLRLSGGQKQRIGIARALYNEPEILVFDESTNSLDEETEKEFMKGVYNLYNKKTVIIISHKKSIIASCEYTFTLNNGRLSKNKI